MILKLFINALSVYFTAFLLSGVHLDDFLVAIGVAIVLAIVNTLLKPILVILTIPITILTLGLFLLVINVLMIQLTDWFIDGFRIDGFIWAVIFAAIMFIINTLLNSLFGLDKKDNN
jgi:putative membrane protein